MCLWMKSLRVTIQVKTTEQNLLEVLLTMEYNLVLTLSNSKSVDEILKCDHSNESSQAVL